jgi:lipopolysaccharide/colanic/teichoic acid biosynthesis glycosyltransferase
MRDARTVGRRPLVAVADEACIRLFDLIVSALALVVLLPLIGGIALAVKLDSPGPVFFHARRVGRNGRVFSMLKFRKMRDDATGPRLTVANDDRLTRIGRCLVRCKLDELPQLWNVVKGDMSLVGPRPEDPAFVELEREAYGEILSITPGISGLSQLAFTKEGEILDPSDRTGDYLQRLFPAKLEIDRMYARNRSLLMNLRIILWTFVAVLGRDVAVHRQTGQLNVRRRPLGAAAPELVDADAVIVKPTVVEPVQLTTPGAAT